MAYRSRASFKLMEIDDRFKLFHKGMNIIDVGAAPGGWSQVINERVPNGNIVAVDLLHMEPIENVIFI